MTADRRGRTLARWALLALSGTLGVRGLVGGGQFLLVPSGDWIGVSTRVLDPTPIDTFLLPGLFLVVALGVLPLTVAAGLYADRGWGWRGALVVAVVLAGWAIVEGIVLGWGERLQWLNLIQGVAMAAIAATALASGAADERSPAGG